MVISVLYFAHYKNVTGCSREEFLLSDGASIDTCANMVQEKYPDLGSLLVYGRCAKNDEFAQAATSLSNGDTVAFMPPMSGG